MGIFDIVKKLTKKEKSKERMQKIRESGKDGERTFENENMLSDIERTHTGSDYKVPVRDSAGRNRKEKWEVKKNNSPLSKRQKETRGLKVKRYRDTPYGKESTIEDRFGNEYKRDIVSGKLKKVRKRDKSVLTSLFGSTDNPKPTTRRKSSVRKKPKSFSNAETLWGQTSVSKSTKRKKPSKRKSSSMDWLLGGSSSKSSSKKSKGNSNVDWLMGGGSSKSSKRKSSRSNVDSIWGSKSSGSNNIWSSSKGKKFKL